MLQYFRKSAVPRPRLRGRGAVLRQREVAAISRIFDPENGFFSTLSRLVDIVGLSLFWALLCIPIVTIGPATAALYYTVVKSFREGQGNTFTLFFKAVWSNLKKGVLCTLIFIPIVLVLYLLRYWYGQILAVQGGSLGLVLYAFLLDVVALVFVGLFCWLFPMLGRFEFTIRQLFSTAFQLLIAHLPTTLLLVALAVVVFLASMRLFILIFLLPTLWALAATYLLERAFKKHMPQENEEEQPQEAEDTEE